MRLFSHEFMLLRDDDALAAWCDEHRARIYLALCAVERSGQASLYQTSIDPALPDTVQSPALREENARLANILAERDIAVERSLQQRGQLEDILALHVDPDTFNRMKDDLELEDVLRRDKGFRGKMRELGDSLKRDDAI